MYDGPNGKHFIMVFEILGVNLLEIMKRYDYKGIPIPLVRRVAKQILIGLDYLHRICRIIHTDLKPENVIVSLTQPELEEIFRKGCLSTVNKTIKTHSHTQKNLFPS
jgi:serine/threonine-protein kinase SRPK3